jgi:hypothetical protein
LGTIGISRKIGNPRISIKTKEYSETSKVGRRGLLFQSSKTSSRRFNIVSLVIEVPEVGVPEGKVNRVAGTEQHLQQEVDLEAVVNKFTVENLSTVVVLVIWLRKFVSGAVHLAVQNKILVEARSSSSC